MLGDESTSPFIKFFDLPLIPHAVILKLSQKLYLLVVIMIYAYLFIENHLPADCGISPGGWSEIGLLLVCKILIDSIEKRKEKIVTRYGN